MQLFPYSAQPALVYDSRCQSTCPWSLCVHFLRLRVLVLVLATWAGVFPDYALAQNTMSSGSAREPRYDAQGRVITAGGFVATGPVIFQDVTTAAGLSPPTPPTRACYSAIYATNSSTYAGSRLPQPGSAVYSFVMRRCR